MDQWEKIQKNLSSRVSEKVKLKAREENPEFQIINCPNDWGVARNGGRIGARFAPQAILKNLINLAADDSFPTWRQNHVCSKIISEDFDHFQKELITKTSNILTHFKGKGLIHLGGGHDHIYPLLMSLQQRAKRIVVFNIDAHLDTRTDNLNHSGTPFRQFAKNKACDFELIQIGIHKFSNPKTNYEQLPETKVSIYHFSKLKELTKNFSEHSYIISRHAQVTDETIFVFSLDCDALESNTMSAVSAVNPEGLSFQVLKNLLSEFNQIPTNEKILGIYEYNPLYENLSEQGSKAIANLIYQFMNSTTTVI